MPYDLFISYSRRDNTDGRITQFIERIGHDFAAFAGRPLRPFFDRTEIHGLENWRHKILQGLRDSRLLLACLSPSYLATEFCEWEFIEYLKGEVARGGEGVAGIYFVEVPGWDDKDFNRRCAEWVADLRCRQHFDLRPWFQAGEEALRDAEVQQRLEQFNHYVVARIQRGERAERSLGNVDAHNPDFVGRVTELRLLRENFVKPGTIGVLTAVHGLGGLGKTALALEYAHTFAHEYGGGRWQVRCEGHDDLRAVLVMLAPALRIEFTETEKPDVDLQFQRVLAELRHLAETHDPRRCLLLLDNVDQPRLLEPSQTQRLPAADWLHVIATTRLGSADLFGRQKDRTFLPIDELPESDALALIERHQPGGMFRDASERAASTEIAQLLGRFTLAVETAAVFLGRYADEVSCAAFRDRLEAEGLTGLEGAVSATSEAVRHGEKSLRATLRPTLERLSPAETLALTVAALLPADQVALPWVRALVTQAHPEYGRDTGPGYPDPWINLHRHLFSLRLWQATSVIDTRKQPLVARMHRLLQEMMTLDAGERADVLERALLDHIRARANFLWDGWVHPEHRWELAPLAASAEHWLGRDGDDGPWLASQAAGLLRQLGQFAAAEPLCRRALAIDERTHGPDHPDVARDLTNLAALLRVTNRLGEAEPLYRRALAIEEKAHGPDHPHVAAALNNLAALLRDTNRLGEAEPLYRRALAIGEKALGPDHPHVATALNNLAELLRDTNRLGEAEPLHRRALAIDERTHGPDHPDVARDLTNLALLLQDTNRLGEAEPLYRRALAIDERSYGPDHPDVARDLNNLAALLRDTNRVGEAEPLYCRALAIGEKALGPDHPHVATALNNLAALLRDTNRLGETEPLRRRALAIDERSYGPDHPKVARDLNNLAELLRDTNRVGEAEPLSRRVLEILLKFTVATGHPHPHLQVAINNYARILGAMGRSPEQIQARLDEIGRPFGVSLGSLQNLHTIG